MVTSHNLCNMPHELVNSGMNCGFESRNKLNRKQAKASKIARELKELFVVRDPLSRAISIYYFWGELYKMKALSSDGDHRHRNKRRDHNVVKSRLGQGNTSGEVEGRLFKYHGNESTVPPHELAYAYAINLPLSAGMPGPSFTWSGFSDNLKDAIKIIDSDRIMSVVTERLDESLVVASHYLGWTLADVVVTSFRKALSSHPKHSEWPTIAVNKIKEKLVASGEYDVYEHANKKLDERIRQLNVLGVDVEVELRLLKMMREKVTQVYFIIRFIIALYFLCV